MRRRARLYRARFFGHKVGVKSLTQKQLRRLGGS